MKIKVNNLKLGCANATAYGDVYGEELGEITVSQIENYLQITSFKVHEKNRNKGIGKILLEEMIKQTKMNGMDTIIVYPKSEAYEGEQEIDIPKLYEIYTQLKFGFCKEKVDLGKYNNKMTMEF